MSKRIALRCEVASVDRNPDALWHTTELTILDGELGERIHVLGLSPEESKLLRVGQKVRLELVIED